MSPMSPMSPMSKEDLVSMRRYGTKGPFVILVHGGPGAYGYLATVAEELSGSYRVLEPFQRGTRQGSCTVAQHVEDLHRVVSLCRDEGRRPAVVGHSWGAMLALAYGAAHPSRVSSLVLVGCGTFDEEARAVLMAALEQRMDDELEAYLHRLSMEVSDPDERLRIMGDLTLPLYCHDADRSDHRVERCDARAHEKTWDDMLRLQAEGVYPASFAAVDAPVLMLHGTDDPHPGRMILAGLRPHVPDLTYRELSRCGHYPWLERSARGEFFAVLHAWLERHTEDRIHKGSL